MEGRSVDPDSSGAPPVQSPYPRYTGPDSNQQGTAEYPRGAIAQKPLKLRLARGLVVGNYWLGAVGSIIIALGLMGVFDEPSGRRESSSGSELSAFVLMGFFFAVGFAIGALSKKRKAAVALLSLIPCAVSGLIWATFLPRNPYLSMPCWLIYIAVSMVAAAYVRRSAVQITSYNA